MPLLEIKGLRRAFYGLEVLRGVDLAVAGGGTGNPTGALVGAYLLMTLLESARFLVADLPGLSAVQKAALKEMLIAIALILVLRLKPSGLIPERIAPAPRLAKEPS